MTNLINPWREVKNNLPLEDIKIQFITKQDKLFVGYFDETSKLFNDIIDRLSWNSKQIKTWRYYPNK